MAEILIQPSEFQGDLTTKIIGRHLKPAEMVRIVARMVDELGRTWQSDATFNVDPEGQVDPSKQASIAGSYDGIDPMGLFWSMSLTDSGSAPVEIPPTFLKQSSRPDIIQFQIFDNERLLAESQVIRQYAGPEIEGPFEPGHGLTGAFYVPQREGYYPAILVLGGSAGGLTYAAPWAAMLASRGFAALALSYFDYAPNNGLPGELVEIPLEYVEKGLSWLVAHEKVLPGKLAVAGLSKGAELALVLAAANPSVQAVVAFAPSQVVFQGLSVNPDTKPRSSWARDNKAIPFLKFPRTSSDFSPWSEKGALLNLHLAALNDAAAATSAAIEVEKICGPILLVSGGRDEIWPSESMSDRIVERLESRRYFYDVKHHHWPEAGHGIFLPNLPADACFGGTPKANAQASREAWAVCLEFLGKFAGGA